MSAHPGKVQIMGVAQASGKKVMVMRMLQGRNAEWVQRPFFAAYDAKAMWLSDLRPAFHAGHFFFEHGPGIGQQWDRMPSYIAVEKEVSLARPRRSS